MNTRLIFQLSIFGIAMGFLTVSLIPSGVEPFLWLAIFIICAFIVAKKCKEKFFMHGFLISLLNSIWLTLVHIIFFQTYIIKHLDEISMMSDLPIPYSPRVMLVMAALPIGIFFGVILGTFSFIASKIVKKKRQ